MRLKGTMAQREQPTTDEMMTRAEVQAFLRVSYRTIIRMQADGRLQGSRLRGPRSELRYKRSDVEAFLERQKGE